MYRTVIHVTLWNLSLRHQFNVASLLFRSFLIFTSFVFQYVLHMAETIVLRNRKLYAHSQLVFEEFGSGVDLLTCFAYVIRQDASYDAFDSGSNASCGNPAAPMQYITSLPLRNTIRCVIFAS